METLPATLSDVTRTARPILERIVWATVATVGPDGRPRTRLMHPVWFWDAATPYALVSTRPTPLKRAHVAAQPAISCHYWDPQHDTVTVDARAEWVPDADRADVWARIHAVAEPVGFDPAMIWPDGPTSPECAFLRFEAHRILARPVGAEPLRWDR